VLSLEDKTMQDIY